jgi:hypothetical protein
VISLSNIDAANAALFSTEYHRTSGAVLLR